MDIHILLRLAALGVVVTVLNLILKQSGKEDIAFFVDLGGVVVIILFFMPYFSKIFDSLNNLFFKY